MRTLVQENLHRIRQMAPKAERTAQMILLRAHDLNMRVRVKEVGPYRMGFECLNCTDGEFLDVARSFNVSKMNSGQLDFLLHNPNLR